ncbi:lipopolysaccharide export system permease protein [Candidatus Magnetomoraceae bacterium gMMP-15]
MSIIYKYLIKQILKYFIIILITIISIYVAVDFFEKIDNFMEADLSIYRAVVFFALKLPFITAQILPVGVLLSILITFGLMRKNNEIVALKASGISVYYLVGPVLIIGLIFSMLLFILSEVFVPFTMIKANHIWYKEVKKQSAITSKEKDIWIKGDKLIAHINFFNPSDRTLFGITLNYFNSDFKLIKRIDAKKGVYEKNRWLLFDLVKQDIEADSETYRVTYPESIYITLDFVPDDLSRLVKKSEEMTFTELFEYIDKVEKEGYDATIYIVDLHAKTAFPFVCLIMCLTGIGMALQGKKEGFTSSIVYGIGLAFLYWIIYSFCISLGHAERLLPFAAAWLTNLIFICVGGLMLIYAE